MSEMSQEIIANAVAPLKALATEKAIRLANELIADVVADFAAHGWDLLKCAPYPNSGIGRSAYKAAIAKHNLYQLIARRVEVSSWRKNGDLDLFNKSEESEDLYVKRCVANAAQDFDMYVGKLCVKTGEVTSASLEVSSSVWGSSVLTVTKPDGSVRWKTQMIINCSVLGKVFNQWPTRLVK